MLKPQIESSRVGVIERGEADLVHWGEVLRELKPRFDAELTEADDMLRRELHRLFSDGDAEQIYGSFTGRRVAVARSLRSAARSRRSEITAVIRKYTALAGSGDTGNETLNNVTLGEEGDVIEAKAM